jgi:uncharacterized protein (TIGR02147 family)
MDVYEATDFREFTLNRLQKLPKRGHGQFRRLSEHLGVHTTFVSQVFKGQKTLSAEQGLGIAEFLGLGDLETRYFVKLIQIEKAGSEKLKKMIVAEAQAIKEQAQQISSRINVNQVLPDEQKAVFYSAWFYSAIRLLVGIDGFQDAETIASYFGLSKLLVQDVINFCLKSELLIRENDVLKVGPNRTHLDPESPFIRLHHLNWRNRALLNIDRVDKDKLHYSSPMTLGKEQVPLIRKMLLELIAEVGRTIDPSPDEELMCLSIDWFRIR